MLIFIIIRHDILLSWYSSPLINIHKATLIKWLPGGNLNFLDSETRRYFKKLANEAKPFISYLLTFVSTHILFHCSHSPSWPSTNTKIQRAQIHWIHAGCWTKRFANSRSISDRSTSIAWCRNISGNLRSLFTSKHNIICQPHV